MTWGKKGKRIWKVGEMSFLKNRKPLYLHLAQEDVER